jgi:hypothetical protein
MITTTGILFLFTRSGDHDVNNHETFSQERLDDHMTGTSAYFSLTFLASRTNAFYQTSTNRLHAHTPKSTRFLPCLVPPTEDSIGKPRSHRLHQKSWHRMTLILSLTQNEQHPISSSVSLVRSSLFLSFFPPNLSLYSLPLIFPTHTHTLSSTVPLFPPSQRKEKNSDGDVAACLAWRARASDAHQLIFFRKRIHSLMHEWREGGSHMVS